MGSLQRNAALPLLRAEDNRGAGLEMGEKEDEQARRESFRDYVVEESKKGNVVFASLDDYGVAPLDEFIKQPADGILYDLNRLPEVVLTFIDDPKWVNDFAVYQVIKRLRELVSEWQPIETAPRGKDVLVLKANGKYAIADWGRYCEYNGGNFTHWMPLPDPPKG